MEAKEIISKMKSTKRDKSKTIMYSIRLTPEQKEQILYWFGNSTNLRDFILDSIEVLKEYKKQGKSDEYANPK